MGSAWDYSAKERGAGGKFSAEFDGLDLAGCAESRPATDLRERGGFARRLKFAQRA